MNRLVRIGLLALILPMAGCSDSELSALEHRLADMRSRPVGKVSALPETPQYHVVTYDQAKGRNPFMPERPETKHVEEGNDLAPDFSRLREPLESYPLDSLKLVGTLNIDRQRSALVRDPEGKVHRLHRGAHLGTDFGRITEITDTAIQLTEIVSNGQNGWTERSRLISLNNDADNQGQG